MSWTDLSWKDILLIIAVLSSAVATINVFFTGRKNLKEYQKERNLPFEKINERLANDKARLDNHEALISSLQKESTDTREGLNVIGKGVQALLEKDESEMKSASDAIKDWVWKGRK